MPSYNFLNLSPTEFEDLSRDLLQEKLGFFLESFMPGPDGGIDLRHFYSPDKQLIVQCKRYQTWESLLPALKAEVANVKQLQPVRYIVTTSVPLNPARKAEIMKVFDPYIASPKDIIGQRELNALLHKFPSIERDHFKLWLSSVNILDKILHSKVVNQSRFEMDEIRETIKLYVENDSYYRSLDIIKNKRYVIISGAPGIGKTTLARILAYHYLADGFEEFVYLSDSIDDAFGAFKEGVKQIFLFDDFLGRNFLDKLLKNNEEQRIVKFIEKVNKADDKILLLTTREYILAQAKLKYDIFENPSLEFAKCLIDLSQYTKLVRAKIFYNHLYFSELPAVYLQNLLIEKAYEKVILHKGYNPRIIETVTHKDVWSMIEPEKFSEKILHYLTYPESVWTHVYENQITRFSQCMLANLSTLGVPVLLTDLKLQMQQFARQHKEKYGITYSELDLKKSLKELENTFISITKDSLDQFVVDYANPSIQDFLVAYFRESPDHLNDVLSSAKYFIQFFKIFIERHRDLPSWADDESKKILYNKEQLELVTGRLLVDLDELQGSSILKIYTNNYSGTEWRKVGLSIYSKLNRIREFFPSASYPRVKEFVLESFKANIYAENLSDEDFDDYMDLYENFESDCAYEPERLIITVGKGLNSIKQLKEFERLAIYNSVEFDDYTLRNKVFREKLESVIALESQEPDDYDLDEVLHDVITLGKTFNLDIYKYQEMIEERIEQYETRQSNDDYWEKQNPSKPAPAKNEDIIIDGLFRSLLNNH